MSTTVIDGSTLEGGGQVLRLTLSLAFLRGEGTMRIHSIRAGRPKPGLSHQHLACVHLAAQLFKVRIIFFETIGHGMLEIWRRRKG